MIFIIGGSFQGKGSFAASLAGPGAVFTDGATTVPEQAVGQPYLLNVHRLIRSVLQEGGDPGIYTEQIIAGRPEIITMDEVGCGVVPLEPFERNYREAAGAAGQRLAAQADCVYRVICGLSQRIK